ncbi:MAG: hypothetical protein ABI042_17860 [Verrucomicrobiota bacterium]
MSLTKASTHHPNTRHVAPWADLFVVFAIDGFVFPEGARPEWEEMRFTVDGFELVLP